MICSLNNPFHLLESVGGRPAYSVIHCESHFEKYPAGMGKLTKNRKGLFNRKVYYYNISNFSLRYYPVDLIT